jgi:ankyrin repeat protein
MQLYRSINKYIFGITLLVIIQYANAANSKSDSTQKSLIEKTIPKIKETTNELFYGLGYGEDTRPEEQGTEIHQAAIENDIKTLGMFLKLFQDHALKSKTSYGNNCLHLSARTGSAESVDLILDEARLIYGKSELYISFILSKNSDNLTALDLASRSGHVEAVKKLLENTYTANFDTKSALKLASFQLNSFSIVNPTHAKKFSKIIKLLKLKSMSQQKS